MTLAGPERLQESEEVLVPVGSNEIMKMIDVRGGLMNEYLNDVLMCFASPGPNQRWCFFFRSHSRASLKQSSATMIDGWANSYELLQTIYHDNKARSKAN